MIVLFAFATLAHAEDPAGGECGPEWAEPTDIPFPRIETQDEWIGPSVLVNPDNQYDCQFGSMALYDNNGVNVGTLYSWSLASSEVSGGQADYNLRLHSAARNLQQACCVELGYDVAVGLDIFTSWFEHGP